MSTQILIIQLSSCLLFLTSVVATSTEKASNPEPIPKTLLQNIIAQPLPAMQKQLDAPSFVEMLMFGLAGIPVYKAVGLLLPFLMGRRGQAKQANGRDNGRVSHYRGKRDLAYAHQLLNLLISVEMALEKYNITEPQCQLRATCEIHRRNVNATKKNKFETNFIKLVSEMRREIKNPKVVPLAKYVFEYYEEAAERGETRCNCKEMYSKCPQSLMQFYKKNKVKKPQRVVSSERKPRL